MIVDTLYLSKEVVSQLKYEEMLVGSILMV
jgi:hypothetical protein